MFNIWKTFFNTIFFSNRRTNVIHHLMRNRVKSDSMISVKDYMEKQKIVYFISGHGDVTSDEFKSHYAFKIDIALKKGDCKFIVGDFRGLDAMAQKYLKDKNANVTVYHMFKSPMNNIGIHSTKGGFKDDKSRDSTMTKDSDFDIAWVREGKEHSGTAKNLKRRISLEGV